MNKILIIDDEFGILEVVQAYLEKEGYEVYTATSGQQGYTLFEKIKPDFVVLDLMLPSMSGEEICEKIRCESKVPILMLTAKKEEEDRIAGLALGADDYLIKPFSPKELVMRVKAIMRRTYDYQIERKVMSFNLGDLTIEKKERVVKKSGKIVDLTKNEYEILKVFCENPNQTFSREQLIKSAFGYDYDGYDRTIDVYIKNLRKKIDVGASGHKYIVTVYGVGYKFKDA